MIGRLTLPVRRPNRLTALRATLDDHLCWHCDDPEWATVLNSRFPGPEVVTDAQTAGRFLLYRAAERLSATVELAGGETATV